MCAHVRHLHVRRGGKTSAFLHDGAQQLVQNPAWLLVRQGQDVVAQRPRADVYVPELSGLNRCVITLNAKPSRLEAPRQVGERTRIDKLTHDAGRRLGKPTDEVEKTKAISPKSWDVLVVDKVLSLESQVIVFLPVAADGQHLVGPFDKGNYVWQCYASFFVVVVFVFVTVQVQVNVALIDDIAIIVQITKARLFVLGFLDVGLLLGRVGQINVTVEPGLLEFHNLVFGLAHHMGDAVASVQVRGPVGQDDVFSRDEH